MNIIYKRTIQLIRIIYNVWVYIVMSVLIIFILIFSIPVIIGHSLTKLLDVYHTKIKSLKVD